MRPLQMIRLPGTGTKKGRTGASAKGATRKVKTRKQPVRRAPSAWLGRLMIALGVVVVIGAAARGALTLEGIPVERITVTGELERTQATAVQEMVQPAVRDGFLRADLREIRSQLEGLPWIFEANVRRRWPSTLEIHVVEQRPIARWGLDGFLNHEGGVFHTNRVHDVEELPLLTGPEGSAGQLMARYQRMTEKLAPLGLTVSELSLDPRGELEAVLGGGTRVLLGKEQMRARMQRFIALHRAELGQRMDEVERVDLRYASGAAVAFAETDEDATGQVAGL